MTAQMEPIEPPAPPIFELLPKPILVAPPDCACRGRAEQMREHTANWCSVMTTDDLNRMLASEHD